MYEDRDYFWVVLCKNHRFHHKGNTSYEHQIALGETDAYSPLPMLTQKVTVRCDDCGAEYAYKPTEILRNEIEAPPRFVPHPLFQQQLSADQGASRLANRSETPAHKGSS